MHENVFYVEQGYCFKGEGETGEEIFRQGFYSFK